MPLVFVIWFSLFLCCFSPAFAEEDEGLPPATPADFHSQECGRIIRGLDGRPSSPLASTQEDYDVTYYDIQVDFRNFSARVIYGNTTIYGRSLTNDFNELVLDLCSSLTVDSVIVASQSQPFIHGAHTLTVSLDRTYLFEEPFSATVFYHGTPCNTNIYTTFGWTRNVSGNNICSIHTLSEPYGARDWWPSKNIPSDKADSAQISITVADTLVATSNGTLRSVTLLPPSSKTYTWFEKYPIASYLISANATNYASFQQWYITLNGDSMPIDHFVFPERLGLAEVSYFNLPEMMDFCAGLYGEYPFVDEKYGHSMFNFNGGMEHQANTSYGRLITNGNNAYDYIMVHELGHQYFGDCVTLRDWPDIWLNEGFATYTEALWYEHTGGSTAYHNYMTSSLSVTDPSGPVYDPAFLFNSNSVYHKGAWLLHMLRGIVRNDSIFFNMFPLYRQAFGYSNATTEQVIALMSEALGLDADAYLHAYIYRTNRPMFQVSYGTGVLDGQFQTVVRIKQVQTDPDTTFHTQLDLGFSGGVTRTVENSERAEKYYFNLGYAPSSLILDPDNWVLKSATYPAMPLTIINQSLAAAFQEAEYADTLVAIAGNPPYSWTLQSGNLMGLEFSSDGILYGVPEDYGSSTLEIKVTDALGRADSLSFVFSVEPAPVPAPWNLSIARLPNSILELRWGASSPADSFRIYRATNGDFTDEILIATTSTKIYHDTLASESPGYLARFYKVIAISNP